MNRSSDDSTAFAQRGDQEPLGLRSFVRPDHPSYRWHSSLLAQAWSLHLLLCRSPSSCSASEPSSSVAGALVGLNTASLETLWRRGSSERHSPNGGT